MVTQAQIEALLQRMREMSAADISVLEASSKTPGSNMTTAPGSRNEALWSEMAGLGWMIIKDEELELPEGRRYLMKIYTISPEGLQPILNLLSTLSQR
ncbi:MAG: hypothetical protein ABSH28_02570 [Acidobacteriota bacterium]|jgi:hypothetical protein